MVLSWLPISIKATTVISRLAKNKSFNSNQANHVPRSPSRTASTTLGPFELLVGPRLAWQQTQDSDRQLTCEPTTRMASRSYSYSWQRCHSTWQK